MTGSNPDKAGWIYLKSRNGHIIGMTDPISWAIDDQWKLGKLERVHADGTPFGTYGDADPAAAAVAASEGARETATAAHIVPMPPPGAHKKSWADYVVKTGRLSAEEAESKTRAELQELVAPVPESRSTGKRA
jgi:hypothetical protein